MSRDSLDEFFRTNIEKLKNAWLSIKQGESLERATHPQTESESFGLGYFDAPVVLLLPTAKSVEQLLNYLGGIPSDDPAAHIMFDWAKNIGRASGSRKRIRLEKALETIGQLGQYRPPESFTGELIDEADED